MKRHLIGAIAVGLTVTLGMSGCSKGSSSGGGGDNKTVRFVAAIYDDKTKGLWENLIKTFEAQNKGYKVNLEMVDWTQMDAKVKTYVQTKQTPDILNYNAFADFARDGLLFPTSDVLSSQVSSDILPSFVEGDKYKGTQYGMPLLSSVRLFFYNKDVFKKAGIDAPPKTWDEVKTDAQKIKSKAKGVFPLGLPLGAEESQAEFFMWAMNNGGGYVDQSGNWTLDSQANVDTLNYLKDLSKSGLTQPNPETTDRKDVFNEFAQGKVGMLNGAVFMPAGFINKVNAKLPYGIAPLPTKAGGHAQHARRPGLPRGLQEQRRQEEGRRLEVPELLLPDEQRRQLPEGRGLPSGDQVGGRRHLGRRSVRQAVHRRPAEREVLPHGQRRLGAAGEHGQAEARYGHHR